MDCPNNYKTLKNIWTKSKQSSSIKEEYAPKITMPYNEWVKYVSQGKNVMYADSIIPGGTVQTGFGGGGAVYAGHVRQNW